MIKEKNPNFKGLWVKYSDYEIVKVNNEFYIKPTKKAEHSSYDVFDYEKEILVDFLYIGREVNNYEFGNSDIQCDNFFARMVVRDKILRRICFRHNS